MHSTHRMNVVTIEYASNQMAKQFIRKLFNGHFTAMITQELYGTLRGGSHGDWCFEEPENQCDDCKNK